ncbi:hypothetical protein HYW67_02380 [Candidatus Parcubacteria bacterium]|nr:hypothetical protein [Candidatus Parcubacteria bacterium]
MAKKTKSAQEGVITSGAAHIGSIPVRYEVRNGDGLSLIIIHQDGGVVVTVHYHLGSEGKPVLSRKVSRPKQNGQPNGGVNAEKGDLAASIGETTIFLH